ncbi:hypothetical protein RFI_23889 [Reticulomyxa filosa]|uniref:Uncharacterized protein n=1 Tax=Reticulomyxa filosa TaxID=46433 RepID=X6MIK3_RETFI|nr:hypothetical protein RFI_23889 [Reticulomyxa filosa]|eukprot:ETO13481.1 hypothetical protein RFI_23889 [Reticulomyxa filosa]
MLAKQVTLIFVSKKKNIVFLFLKNNKKDFEGGCISLEHLASARNVKQAKNVPAVVKRKNSLTNSQASTESSVSQVSTSTTATAASLASTMRSASSNAYQSIATLPTGVSSPQRARSIDEEKDDPLDDAPNNTNSNDNKQTEPAPNVKRARSRGFTLGIEEIE